MATGGGTLAANKLSGAFVVEFHPLEGNRIVWKYPSDAELDGIEFKAMPSGSHVLNFDIANYHVSDGQYAVSCFRSVKDESVARNLRARAVGVIAPNTQHLHLHRDFLAQTCQAQLDAPDDVDYTPLQDYVLNFDAAENTQLHWLDVVLPSWTDVPGQLPTMEATMSKYPVSQAPDSLATLVGRFGKRIMVLWKLSLLKKRIIFLTTPPVDEACQAAYACAALSGRTLSHPGYNEPLRPYGYQNLADIPTISNETNFVCCVTETIFEPKTQLYDVFIKDDKFYSGSDKIAAILKITSSDTARFKRLSSSSEEGLTRDESYIKFFVELNNRILTALETARNRPTCRVTKEDILAVGLHPKDDLALLIELGMLYCPEVEFEDMNDCSCL
eukprot:m.28512 g.28512  ORF g.28512 m.28512 type:complete len:387 (+) comp11850_c0_seq2:72-1232(+)